MKTFVFLLVILPAAVASAGGIESHEALVEYHYLYGQISGYQWFGLRHDGRNVAGGMRIDFTDRKLLGSVEFHLHNPGHDNNGILPMRAGDPIHVVVMTLDEVVLARTTAPLPMDVGYAWVEFPFAEPGVDLAPGSYLVCAYTEVPRQCGMAYCNDQAFPGGARATSLYGPLGPWTIQANLERAFRLHLEPPTVATDAPTWTSLRARFR